MYSNYLKPNNNTAQTNKVGPYSSMTSTSVFPNGMTLG